MVTTRAKTGQLEHVRFQLPKITTIVRAGRYRHIMCIGDMDRGRSTSSNARGLYSSGKTQGKWY